MSKITRSGNSSLKDRMPLCRDLASRVLAPGIRSSKNPFSCTRLFSSSSTIRMFISPALHLVQLHWDAHMDSECVVFCETEVHSALIANGNISQFYQSRP